MKTPQPVLPYLWMKVGKIWKRNDLRYYPYLSICNRIRVGKSFILGVFIKSGLFQEAFDFEAFIRPFDASTWLCLFCSAALLTICIINIWKTTNCKKEMLSNGVKVYLKILQTNLGKDSYRYGRKSEHSTLIFKNLKPVEKSKNQLSIIWTSSKLKCCIDFQN